VLLKDDNRDRSEKRHSDQFAWASLLDLMEELRRPTFLMLSVSEPPARKIAESFARERLEPVLADGAAAKGL
jgi:hypothetical protein